MRTNTPQRTIGHNVLNEYDFSLEIGDDLPKECIDLIQEKDFSYRILVGDEEKSEVLKAIKRIDNDKQVVAVPERTDVWYKGWDESLQEFKSSGYDLNSLLPKYFRVDTPMRWRGNFIKSNNKKFELDFWRVLETYIFLKYFNEYEHIYEFGCGTGKNLVDLVKLYPNKQAYGMDFVGSSVELINLIAEKKKLPIIGKKFDMIHPDYAFDLNYNSAIYTVGSIEQLGDKNREFISWCLQKHPKICVHVEPVPELYNLDNLIDYLGYKFSTKRCYSKGFLSAIEQQEREGALSIVKLQRIRFGNLNHESYNIIVWKPCN